VQCLAYIHAHLKSSKVSPGVSLIFVKDEENCVLPGVQDFPEEVCFTGCLDTVFFAGEIASFQISPQRMLLKL
jgi:hypothetical protein